MTKTVVASLLDLARHLCAEGDVHNVVLDVDDLQAITHIQDLSVSQETTLTELSTAAKRNSTVTRLTLSVDKDTAESCFRIINVLLRDLSLATELHLTFDDPAVGILTTFLERCFHGTHQLTCISIFVPNRVIQNGMFDWSIFASLKNLRSFSLDSGSFIAPRSRVFALRTMLQALSELEHLERLVYDGIHLDIESTVYSDAVLITGFLQRRRLDTLHLGGVCLNSGVVLRSFALGLVRSTIKHLGLVYSCNSTAESTLIMMAIATCTEFRTLSLTAFESSISLVPPCFLCRPILLAGATILRQNTRLSSLKFDNFVISDDEARDMSLELGRSSCALQNLELDRCYISFKGIELLLSSLIRLVGSTANIISIDPEANVQAQGLLDRFQPHQAIQAFYGAPIHLLRSENS